MGWPVVIVDSGGLPVTEATNGLGIPVSVATNGIGTAVTLVDGYGLPVVGLSITPPGDYVPTYYFLGF